MNSAIQQQFNTITKKLRKNDFLSEQLDNDNLLFRLLPDGRLGIYLPYEINGIDMNTRQSWKAKAHYHFKKVGLKFVHTSYNTYAFD